MKKSREVYMTRETVEDLFYAHTVYMKPEIGMQKPTKGSLFGKQKPVLFKLTIEEMK